MKLKDVINNKKLIYVIVLILVLIEISSLFLMSKTLLNKDNSLDEVKLKSNGTKGMFAILLQQDDGEYIESGDSTWPTNYTYNSEKSGCMNESGQVIAGALEFDTLTNKAKITTNETAYCYLYFDIIPKTDTEKLIERETTGTGLWVSTLKDDGYRYVGTNPPNYICFGTTDRTTCTFNPDLYMYRIIGSFADGEGKQHLKLIKKEALNTAYYWDTNYEDVDWRSSTLYNGLNGNYFLNNTTYSYMQNDTWFSKIETWDYMAANNDFENTSRSYHNDTAQGIYMHEMLRDSRYMEEELGQWATVSSKIGVMYASDYMLSLGSESLNLNAWNDSATLKTGWMHLSNNDSGAPDQDEWSMAREGYLDGENYVYTINRDGSIGIATYAALSVRPVFYLKADVKISGSGSASDPYRLS